MGAQRQQLSSLLHFLREPLPPLKGQGSSWLAHFLFPPLLPVHM